MSQRSRAYYEALPIYKAAMDVAVAMDGAVREFPRFHKYAIGTELRMQAIALLQLVPQANRRAGRAEALERLCAGAEGLKVLVNLGKEVEAFASFRAYAEIAAKGVDLARQAEAWRRHGMGGQGPERPRPPSSEGTP